MPLLSLPNEILFSIAVWLKSDRDINNFARTNRRLYNLLDRYLYRRNAKWGKSSALLWAARKGRETTAQKSLDEGADIEAEYRGNFGNYWTPLMLAARYGRIALVELLITKGGADPNYRDENGRTALFWAAEHGQEDVVELLLAKEGIDPNPRNYSSGVTPLLAAAERGYNDVVKLFLAKDGIELNPKDTGVDRTPFLWAAANGHEEVVELLMATDGVDLECCDAYGETALEHAQTYHHDSMVELLLRMKGTGPEASV